MSLALWSDNILYIYKYKNQYLFHKFTLLDSNFNLYQLECSLVMYCCKNLLCIIKPSIFFEESRKFLNWKSRARREKFIKSVEKEWRVALSPEMYLIHIIFLHRKSSSRRAEDIKKVGCAAGGWVGRDTRTEHRREIIKMENFEARKCALGFLFGNEKIAVDNGWKGAEEGERTLCLRA